MLVNATYIPAFLKNNLDSKEKEDHNASLALFNDLFKIEFIFQNDEDLILKVFTIPDVKSNGLYIVFIYTFGKMTPTRVSRAKDLWNEKVIGNHSTLTETIEFLNFEGNKYFQDIIEKKKLELVKQVSKSPFENTVAIAMAKYKILKASQPLDKLWNGALAPAINYLQNKTLPKQHIDITNILLEADKNRTNTEKLDATILSDPQLGHWDLYWPNDIQAEPWYTKTLLKNKLCARNPVSDIQKHIPVAIDFGTTSTVVALRENGVERLLRIGVRDWRSLDPKDYENPTVLEILDFKAFMQDWQNLPYRPFTQWKQIKYSHEAKEDMQQNATCSIMQSGLTGLKTWAHSGGKNILHRRDQQKKDFTLKHLPIEGEFKNKLENKNTSKQPILHENIINFQSRDFDPIEVYAWFLGLSINNQLQGGGRIYHEYYLSFPIKFPRETRERILHSFKRGLERSMPPSLGLSQEWIEHSPLRVYEGANEPVAYAASALPALKLEPTEEGLAFGVFDFGGGTTDFAVGLYRLSTTAEEHDEGWEQVLELLDSSGDAFLGGEHLLHHMTYLIMEENISNLLKAGRGVPFTKPIDAQLFIGSEALIDNSLVAQTNTNKLFEALRPLWEGQGLDSEIISTGQIQITLFDRDDNEITLLPLTINTEKLENYLQQRILQGVENFFSTFRQAFKRHEKRIDQFHILLAGNSCRSVYVHQAFETMCKKIFEDEYVPNETITLHNPLLQCKDSLFSLKTGVALGLLHTAPGESTGIVQKEVMPSGETTFRFNVGTFKRNILDPILSRHSEYNTWHPLGIVRKDLTLVLGYSTSALALEKTLSRQECLEKRFSFEAKHQGKALTIRAITPTSFEIGIKSNTNNDIISLQIINLD